MKPKLGRIVYCIFDTGILVDTVGFLGKNSFIINSFGPATEYNSWEWEYDTYNEKWFTSLTKAKKYLIEKNKNKYDNNLRVIQITNSWYALEFY